MLNGGMNYSNVAIKCLNEKSRIPITCELCDEC